MATHHCVGSPCWICYPQLAPQPQPYYKIPENKISNVLRDLLVAVFKQGLDEDEHFRVADDQVLDLEKIKTERANIDSTSLEAELLDLMIADFENKSV